MIYGFTENVNKQKIEQSPIAEASRPDSGIASYILLHSLSLV